MSTTPTDSEIEDALRQSAAGPAEASNETGTIKQHSLKDQMGLVKFNDARAVTNPFKCVRHARTEPAGASGLGTVASGE